MVKLAGWTRGQLRGWGSAKYWGLFKGKVNGQGGAYVMFDISNMKDE